MLGLLAGPMGWGYEAAKGVLGGGGGGGSSPGGVLGAFSGGNTPQDKGYGIAAPQPFQPYQTPGLQSWGQTPQASPQGGGGQGFGYGASSFVGAAMNAPAGGAAMPGSQLTPPGTGFGYMSPSTGQYQQQAQQSFAGATPMQMPGSGGLAQTPQGWDFASPGVAEQTFNNQQQRFFAPSQANQFAQQNSSTFKSPGVGEQYWKGINQNFGRPGEMESWYDQNASGFAAPGAGEQYWNQVQGKFNQPTASSQAYSQFQGMEPGLDPYYARARERTAGAINDQLAARGQYGSGVGLRTLGDAMAGLGAEQANRESEYMLNQARTRGALAQGADAADMSQVLGLGGLAQGAGSAALARQGMAGNFANMAQASALNRMVTGQNLASGVQNLGQGRVTQGAALNQMGQADELARLIAGMNAAQQAQEARRMRGRDYMEDVYAPSADMASFIDANMNQALMNDQALMDSSLAMQTGLAADAVNAGYRNAEKQKADASWLGGMASGLFGL